MLISLRRSALAAWRIAAGGIGGHASGGRRGIGPALVLVPGLLASAFQPALVHAVEVELVGTLRDVTLTRPDLGPHGATAALSFDVDYTYVARTLLGEPVINCAVRVRNLRGEISFSHDGKEHRVALDPANTDMVRITDMDLVVTKRDFNLNPPFASLFCNTGVPARENSEAFNVPSSPNWAALYCIHSRAPDLAVTEKLRREQSCDVFHAFGRHLTRDEAMRLFANDALHQSASISVGALALNVNDLVNAALREAGRERDRAAEGDDHLRHRLAATLDRLAPGRGEDGRAEADRAPGVQGGVDRMLGRVTADRRIADQRREVAESRERAAGLSEEREKAIEQCSSGRPRDPGWEGPRDVISLTAVYPDMTHAEREENRRRSEEARRRRAAEERERMAERVRRYETELAAWERRRDQCLVEQNAHFDAEHERLEREHRAARRRLDAMLNETR
jgi:hypothetical protein